jgi:hypothetical protein
VPAEVNLIQRQDIPVLAKNAAPIGRAKGDVTGTVIRFIARRPDTEEEVIVEGALDAEAKLKAYNDSCLGKQRPCASQIA